MRRVVDREAHVGNAHRVKGRVSASAFLPRSNESLTQHAEPFGGDGRQECALVGEVAIERRTRDADASADVAKGHPFDALGADGGERLVEERAAEVAVM